MHDNLRCGKPRTHKVIRFFFRINYHGNHRNNKHGENKRSKKFFKNIPVKYFHSNSPGATCFFVRGKSNIKKEVPAKAALIVLLKFVYETLCLLNELWVITFSAKG